MIKAIPHILIGFFLAIAALANAQLNFDAVYLYARGKHLFVNGTDTTPKPSLLTEYTTMTTVIGPTSTETITLCNKCTPKVTSSTTVITKTISGATITVTEPCKVTYTSDSTTTIYHGGSTVTITIPKTKVKTVSTTTTASTTTIYSTVTITKPGGSVITTTVPCTTDVTTVTTTSSKSVITYTITRTVPITTTTIDETLNIPSSLPLISTKISGAPSITTTHQPVSETTITTAIITPSVPSMISNFRSSHITVSSSIIPSVSQVNGGVVFHKNMAALFGGLALAGVIVR